MFYNVFGKLYFFRVEMIMKREIVLLIIFGLVGGLLLMSSCDGQSAGDIVAECACSSVSCLGYTAVGSVVTCFQTCANCPADNVECTGDPCQYVCDCNIAFMESCINSCTEIVFDNVDCSCGGTE